MHLESHALPTRATLEQRHAALHRAIERGLDADELWSELAAVCMELGLDDEAWQCVRRLHGEAARLALESRLQRRAGIAGATAATSHAVAPAASNAGPTADDPTESPEGNGTAGLLEHLLDALQYQFQQQQPWVVLTATLASPLVVGLVGLTTIGDSPLAVAALAALPLLALLTLGAATSRRILRRSAEGYADVPRLGDLGPLLADALRAVADAALVGGLLLGPALFALYHGAPWATTLPGLLVGLFFLPLAWSLRQVRGDLRALSPVVLLRGVARTGVAYLGLLALLTLLAAPAVAAGWLCADRPLWLQLALAGPFGVLPAFVASRLLGTWLDSMKGELGTVLLGHRAWQPRDVRELVDAAPADVHRPRAVRRPDGLAQFEAPRAKGHRPQRKVQPAAPATPPAPSTPPTAPAPETVAIEGRGPTRPRPEDRPDLRGMPGAVVVSGDERVRQGAAARPR